MSNKFLSGRIKELLLGIAGRTEDKTVLQTTGTVGIGTTNSLDYTLYVDGSANIDGGVNVTGVSTFQDRVIFDSTNSIQIPSGTEAQKDAVGVAVTGQVRFNTTNQQFEGFGVGNNWGSLGGVKDVDGDTEIKAELSAGSDEDNLYFYNGGYLSATISSEAFTVNVPISLGYNLEVTGIATVSGDFDVDGDTKLDNLNVSGVSTFSGTVDIDGDIDIDGHIDLDNVSISGVTTFTNTTDNTLGDADTGAVQIDGGLGVNKNVTVGAGLSVVSGFNVAGLSTFQSDVHLGDNDKLIFGDDDDLEIFHNSSNGNTIIQETTGGNLVIKGSNLFLQSASGEDFFKGDADGAVELYYDDTKKFETTGAGVTVFGTTQTQQLNVSGVATFQGNINLGELDRINFYTTNTRIYGNSFGLNIEASGNNDVTIQSNSSGSNAGDVKLRTVEGGRINLTGTGGVGIYHTDTAKKFETTSTGVIVTGILTATEAVIGTIAPASSFTTINDGGVEVVGVVTATSFEGDGSALTNISASVPANLTATTLNVSGVTTAANFRTNSTTGDGSDVGFAIKYYVTSNGSSSYRFAGPGLINTTDNPTLYLHRGFTYIFENSTGGSHPFRIQFTGTTTGVGTYVSGSQSGTQVFTIPFDAPSSYEYQCTLHGGMKGTLAIPT